MKCKWLFEKHIPLWVCLFTFLFSIPFLIPYIHPGYFPTHDGEWAVIRLGDMYRLIKDYQIPPRYSGNLNFGYGYPLFEFAYPLPYYLGLFLHLLHNNLVNAIKILFALTIPVSFFGMYLFTAKLWKNQFVGIISAIIYIYYPYRLVDLFVRGSIGESIAFTLFPFILYFILRIHTKDTITDAIFSGMCISALIMSHNIMAVEFLPVILVFIMISLYEHRLQWRKFFKIYSIVLLLGLGISCFFWLPALYEKKLITLSVIPIADRNLYFVQPWQFIWSAWGYGTRDFSYQLGIPQMLLVITILFSFFKNHKILTSTFISKYSMFFMSIFFIYIFLLFSPSQFIWKIVPLFKEINYPWTLLAVIGFLLSTMVGYISTFTRGKVILSVLALFSILYCIPYAHPSSYIDKGDSFYLTNDATTTSSDEYMPLWVKQKPSHRVSEFVTVISAKGAVTTIEANSKKFVAKAKITKKGILQLNKIYYPGWHLFIDGTEVLFSYKNKKGLITFFIPSGTHIIEAKFIETPLRLFADIITVVSCISILFLLGMSFYKKRIYVEKT